MSACFCMYMFSMHRDMCFVLLHGLVHDMLLALWCCLCFMCNAISLICRCVKTLCVTLTVCLFNLKYSLISTMTVRWWHHIIFPRLNYQPPAYSASFNVPTPIRTHTEHKKMPTFWDMSYLEGSQNRDRKGRCDPDLPNSPEPAVLHWFGWMVLLFYSLFLGGSCTATLFKVKGHAMGMDIVMSGGALTSMPVLQPPAFNP